MQKKLNMLKLKRFNVNQIYPKVHLIIFFLKIEKKKL